MHIFTNCSVNGTVIPDAVYVPGSGMVTYPNGTVVQMDPSPMPVINPNNTYEIRWNPGVIKLNDTWSVTYQLRVQKGGIVTPIMNNSFVSFIRDDGTTGMTNFTSETLYASDTPNGSVIVQSPRILVNITSPTPKDGGFNVTSLRQPISWYVNYTGNQTYHQTISWVDEATGEERNISVNDPAYNGYLANTQFMYTWSTESIPPGNYTIVVYAYDTMYRNFDEVHMTIPYSRGQIILQ